MSSCGVGFVCDIRGAKSHDIVSWGIEAVKNLTHRGAVGADGKTGDGAGVLFEIPRKFFLNEIERQTFTLSHGSNLAVAVFFLKKRVEPEIEEVLRKHHLRPVGWRDVPTDDSALGESACATKPAIRHLFIDTHGIDPGNTEIRLYLARRAIEKRFERDVYIPSMSAKTIVYKGLLVAPQLDRFYPDLKNKDFESAFSIFHQRFSTNTLPDWTLAQPLRVLAHNGEINTIQGNRNWMAAIEHEVIHEIFGDAGSSIRPLVSNEESDSASLDRIIELLMLAGYSPEHALMLCIPPAWETSDLSEEEKSFFEYQSLRMKPWDGPAAVAFTDGNTVGAHLDRNGLRPLRYAITEDGILVLGSETGMIDLGDRTIREKGRLGPGDTLSVNLQKGRVACTEDVIREIISQKPYRKWIERSLTRLGKVKTMVSEPLDDTRRRQAAFGYTMEEIDTSIKTMTETAKELIFSMGDDTPLPPLSGRPPLLFRYFKQRFSQVTNPPIDPIRERMVMSLRMNLGHKRNFLIETEEHARRLSLDSPILLSEEMKGIEEQAAFKIERIPLTYSREEFGEELQGGDLMTCCAPGRGFDSPLSFAVRRLQKSVEEAVRKGVVLLLLSDRDISKERIAIPSLLAIAASFDHLRRKHLANRVSFIIETGEAREIHHMACLIGYGASAVYPYLAYETIEEMCARGTITIPFPEAVHNYKKALEDGLLKVIARMGISTINSYHAAALFDALCLNKDFVDAFFGDTSISIESDGLAEIEDSLMKRHEAGFAAPEPVINQGGDLLQRKEGEWHAWSPLAVAALNRFVRSGDYRLYREFSRLADERPVFIRHLLTHKKGGPVPLEEVEAEEEILKRFFSGAMSVGALSPEAHETIAEACNALGIKSNSGEGGEDPLRYWSPKNSAIKQIASGRFGVTPTYVASARDLEIKIAQGAKPGEGGHLPENKVTEYIAMLRHCSPSTLLISPPPHHDIYSIEDLAQLIHDLKQANPEAKVCVKLVSEKGVGTVAAGVAKSYADIVQISGCEGGTGASPIGSIKNAGDYWETGLAETQAILIENGLRGRVRLRVDGGLRTGKDVIIAALLGAEEFGFGTATMIATGCVMARKCHLNTCPTGIATQDEKLRSKFRGKIEGVTAYFTAVVREVREIMAEMGFRRFDEMIGRSDLLTARTEYHGITTRLNLDQFFGGHSRVRPGRCLVARNDNPAPSMNNRLSEELLPFIEKGAPVEKEYEIRNIDRSIPIRLNFHIAVRYRDEGLPPDTIRLTFRGTAGQSFGAFNHRGLSLTLIGDANDYVGKGMYGGRIVIRSQAALAEDSSQVVAGNTVLYGAVGGEFFVAGRVGERFAVRNSGATAVAEGTGHHLCEYMTRGTVAVIGEVGHSVGAGMTGGILYLFDEDDTLTGKLDTSYVRALSLTDEDETGALRALIERHYQFTGSIKAREILDVFPESLIRFKKVVPLSALS